MSAVGRFLFLSFFFFEFFKKVIPFSKFLVSFYLCIYLLQFYLFPLFVVTLPFSLLIITISLMFLFFSLLYFIVPPLTSCISFHSEFFLCDGLGKHCIVREVVYPSSSFLSVTVFLFSPFLFLPLSLSWLPASISYSSSSGSSYLLCFPSSLSFLFLSSFGSVASPVFFVGCSSLRRFYVVLPPLFISSSSPFSPSLSSPFLPRIIHPLLSLFLLWSLSILPPPPQTPCFRLTTGLLTPSVAWSGVMAEVMCATYSHDKHVVALGLAAT